MKSTSDLVKLAVSSPDSLEYDDYTQLAYYSWGQDFNVLPEGNNSELFKSMAEYSLLKNPEASARLFLQHLVLNNLKE